LKFSICLIFDRFSKDWEHKPKEIVTALIEEGLLTKECHTYNIRLSPPLIFGKENCDELLEKFDQTLAKLG